MLADPEYALSLARNAQETVRLWSHDARAQLLEKFLSAPTTARAEAREKVMAPS